MHQLYRMGDGMSGTSEVKIYWNTLKMQNLFRWRFLPDDQIFPIIDIDICKSDDLACVRRQKQNVLSEAYHDVEKIQKEPKI